MASDPRWPTASSWLDGSGTDVAVLGAPVRRGSISGGRFDLAPGAVRAALARFSVWDGEDDLRRIGATDLGDLDIADATPEEAAGPVAEAVRQGMGGHRTLVLLGGDNSITRPACLGLGPPLARIGLLTFDAHHDLRDTGTGLTNGNPVRALLDAGLPGEHIVQIGIQPFANAPEHAAVAREAGITVATADEVRAHGMPHIVLQALKRLEHLDAIHVDLDVDVLDRSFAPACPGARPGGLTPAELQAAARACGEHPRVSVMDLVEVDPERDVAEATVLAAASFLLAFAAGVAARA